MFELFRNPDSFYRPKTVEPLVNIGVDYGKKLIIYVSLQNLGKFEIFH